MVLPWSSAYSNHYLLPSQTLFVVESTSLLSDLGVGEKKEVPAIFQIFKCLIDLQEHEVYSD